MNSIRVHRLPKTLNPVLLETHSRPLRFARLKSLQLDAQAFVSKYEDEILQPPEFWLNRLRPANCQHFVAVASPQDDSKDVEYKAFMVVLAASAPTEVHDLPTYVLAAFWVNPEMRGQKVGSRVVEESIQWIREDARKHGWEQIQYQLEVKSSNHRAINLYERLGFSSQSEDKRADATAEDQLTKMSMKIDIS